MPIIRGKHDFDEQFTQIPNAWVRDTRLSLKAKGLLAQILSHAPGWSLSIRALATANQCGVDMIRSAVDELMSAGYLTRSDSRERNEQGHLQDYVYMTHDPVLENPTLDFPTLDNPTPKNTIPKEEQVKEVNHQNHFDKFWELYPRKVGKTAARNAYVKACQSANEFIIIGGAERMANDPNLPEMTYIPHPATWLNRGGWEDAPYPPRERTKAELEAMAREKALREREAAREASEAMRAEWREAEKRATAAPTCEHDLPIWKCRKCTTRLAEEDARRNVT